MKRELKKHIKQDEFVSGLDRAIQWLSIHQREAKVTAAIVLGLGAGWLALSSYQGSQARAADQAFGAALEAFHSPVAGQTPEEQTPAEGKVYPTATDKYREAAQKFAEVHRRYGWRPAGLRSRYYEGLCRIELGQHQEAEKALAEVAARRDEALEASLARLALADLERRRGNVDKALAAYRQMVDDASLGVPRDHVLMSLSTALEDAQRLGEARQAYQRLADEFPSSVYASEARRRAEFLKEPVAG